MFGTTRRKGPWERGRLYVTVLKIGSQDAGQAMLESYAVDIGLPLVSFRPQYIYGPKSNKHDYIDWYFDRLVRELPLPIPGDGHQKVSLTHSEDVASLVSISAVILPLI